MKPVPIARRFSYTASMRRFPSFAPVALLALLSGCAGGGDSDPEAAAFTARCARLASDRPAERIAAFREFVDAGPTSLSSLSAAFRRHAPSLPAAQAAEVTRVIGLLRRQTWALESDVSPRIVQCFPCDIDPHYRAWVTLRTWITRDEPLRFALHLEKRLPAAPALWLHHFDAVWTAPAGRPADRPGAAAPERPLRSIADQVPSARWIGRDGEAETVAGGVVLRDRERLFDGAPPVSLAAGAARDLATAQVQLRFFMQTERPDGRSFEASYRKTAFLPVTVLNTSRAILESDAARYVAELTGAPVGRPLPETVLDRMDAYVPPFLGARRWREAFAGSRRPASDAALLAHAAGRDDAETRDAIAARAAAGSREALRALAAWQPLHPAGFTLERNAPPPAWKRLSRKTLTKALADGDAADAVAAARILAHTGRPGPEAERAFRARLEAFANEETDRGAFDALLALAREFARPETIPALAAHLSDARLLAPKDLPPAHPLLAFDAGGHDLRVSDAAAAGIVAAAGRDLSNVAAALYENPRRRRFFKPLPERDAAIAAVRTWWEKRQKP